MDMNRHVLGRSKGVKAYVRQTPKAREVFKNLILLEVADTHFPSAPEFSPLEELCDELIEEGTLCRAGGIANQQYRLTQLGKQRVREIPAEPADKT